MKSLPEKIILTHSLDQLPPPYSYQYHIEIDLQNDNHINFEIEYLDREEISQEEVEAEGFSENDDFKWEGDLPSAWDTIFSDIPNQLNDDENGGSVSIQIIENGKVVKKQPKNPSGFEYLIQELIQAIYEKTGKQEVLNIDFLEIDNSKKSSYRLSVSFLDRLAKLDNREVSWNTSTKVMSRLFSFDFDEFNALQKAPTKHGFYVNTGDGLWYKADGSIKDSNRKPVKEQLQRLLSQLKES